MHSKRLKRKLPFAGGPMHMGQIGQEASLRSRTFAVNPLSLVAGDNLLPGRCFVRRSSGAAGLLVTVSAQGKAVNQPEARSTASELVRNIDP